MVLVAAEAEAGVAPGVVTATPVVVVSRGAIKAGTSVAEVVAEVLRPAAGVEALVAQAVEATIVRALTATCGAVAWLVDYQQLLL